MVTSYAVPEPVIDEDDDDENPATTGVAVTSTCCT